MIFFELMQDVKMPITTHQISRTPNSQATHIHWGASSLPGSGKNCPGDQWRGWCDTMFMSHTNGVRHERKGHVTSKWQCCDRPWLSCSDPGRVKPKSPRFLKCESMSRCQVVRLGVSNWRLFLMPLWISFPNWPPNWFQNILIQYHHL